ncbi:hypothetical protein H5410_037833 [Solanum commersonii]|uniref:Uncharacterized protein n=1 Tax=Solanum commersonii TaxID=4109 RepID=A0A9J5Y8B4_SOLCO|nr:hypothetical protein H5410_037833 [Solanum commersonii]
MLNTKKLKKEREREREREVFQKRRRKRWVLQQNLEINQFQLSVGIMRCVCLRIAEIQVNY